MHMRTTLNLDDEPWIDVHVLASAVLARTNLWTLDGPLRRAAQRLHVAY